MSTPTAGSLFSQVGWETGDLGVPHPPGAEHWDNAITADSIVTDVENFAGMSSAEIRAQVAAFDPSMVSGDSASWNLFQRSARNIAEGLAADVERVDAPTFQGEWAEAVAARHARFLIEADTLISAMDFPADRLVSFSTALERVKAEVPHPVAGPSFQTSDPFTAVLAQPDPKLIALMESTYRPGVIMAGSGMSAFPGPTPLEGSGGSAGGTSGVGGGGSGSGGGGGASPQAAPNIPGSGAQAVGPPDAGADEAPVRLGEVTPGEIEVGPGSDFADDTAVTQAGLSPDGGQTSGGTGGRAPASPASPAGIGGAGVGGGIPLTGPLTDGARGGSAGGSGSGPRGTAGSAGSGGRGLGGSRGGGVGGPGSGIPGAMRSGAMGGLGGPGEPVAGGNAMASRRGMSGGMMGGGAGRGRGEEDDGYEPAEFLTTIDNGDKLIGPLPRVVHPVIGAWND